MSLFPASRLENAWPQPGQRVVVGLSGGVDSAVAAARLLETGVRVEGLFMKNWDDDDADGVCAAEEDLAAARSVAQHLGIVLHKRNFAADYRDRVFADFLAEYRAGRTPNPDILCNREVKFGPFLEHARALGATAIATGHYARVLHSTATHCAQLLTAADDNKDQTYFLHRLDARQLDAALFPIGDLPKPEVRRIARELGLPNHARRDSTGICFIGERNMRVFLERYLDGAPGPIETPDGVPIGEHPGLMFFTPGQRQGLGIGGVRGFQDAPWYVVAKDDERRALIVAQDPEHPLLMSDSLICETPHWIGDAAEPFDTAAAGRIDARIRHRQTRFALAALTPVGARCDRWRVRFSAPQRAVTPGQSIAFYRGDACLGGAIIAAAGSAHSLAPNHSRT